MAQIITDKSISRIKQSHRFIIAKTISATAEAAIEAGEFAKQFVYQSPGFKPRSGELQRATEWQTVRTASGRIVRIRNRKAYAAPIDLGSKPHVIEARRRKALAFSVGGKLIFRRRVNHPGNRPYRFLYRATNAAGRVLGQVLAVKMARISKQF